MSSGTDVRQRTHIVSVRMNDAEFDRVKALAAQAGESVGAYLRGQGVGERPRPAHCPANESTSRAQALYARRQALPAISPGHRDHEECREAIAEDLAVMAAKGLCEECGYPLDKSYPYPGTRLRDHFTRP